MKTRCGKCGMGFRICNPETVDGKKAEKFICAVPGCERPYWEGERKQPSVIVGMTREAYKDYLSITPYP